MGKIMKLNKILVLILSIFIIAVAINSVDAAQIDNSSNEVIASSDSDLAVSSEVTHTYAVTGKSVYVKDYNPNYKLSEKAKKQVKNAKKAPKKTYKITISDAKYKNLKNAKKTKQSVGYTVSTNYKCKVLKPVLKTTTIKKTIVNKKFTSRQKYLNAYAKYFSKYNSAKYDMDVKFHFYKGTNAIKYATIKVTKKVKQVKITKFKTVYTNIKADIGYSSHDGQVGKGSFLLVYGNIFGYDFTNFVAHKYNFI